MSAGMNHVILSRQIILSNGLCCLREVDVLVTIVLHRRWHVLVCLAIFRPVHEIKFSFVWLFETRVWKRNDSFYYTLDVYAYCPVCILPPFMAALACPADGQPAHSHTACDVLFPFALTVLMSRSKDTLILLLCGYLAQSKSVGRQL